MVKIVLLRKDTPIMDIKPIEKLTTTIEVDDQLQEAFIVTTTAYKNKKNQKKIKHYIRIVIEFRPDKSNGFGILSEFFRNFSRIPMLYDNS